MSHIPDDPATDPEGDITDTTPDETTPEARGRSLRNAATLTAAVGIVFSVLFTLAFVLLLDLPTIVLGVVLALLALASLVTVVQRILEVRRQALGTA